MTGSLEERFQNLHEFVTQARTNLNRNNWDYLIGGSETETTLARNRAALDAWGFRPRVLRDVSNVDSSRTFFGKKLRIPVLCSAVGGLEVFEPGGGAAVAAATREFGNGMILSSGAHPGMEKTAEASGDGFLNPPEEVVWSRYFETHKHEIPRSHEICVKRYQRNEQDIRKLDAKYGNLVSMIQGLGQKHQPMLPTKEEENSVEVEQASNERVEDWAKAVSTDGVDHEEERLFPEDEEDRESRFDRPLKEVRVGESPSRPWGISVPILDPPERPVSPPPAPVSVEHAPKQPSKCPFGHGAPLEVEEKPAGNGPFPQTHKVREQTAAPPPQPHKATRPTFVQPGRVSENEWSSPPDGFYWACVHWLSHGASDCLYAALQQHAMIDGNWM